MPKSRVEEQLSAFYRSLMRDCRSAYPTLEVEFERDLSRLLTLVKSRGIRVFLVDLAAAGKHFDRCLANSKYELSGLPLTKRFSNRVVIPKFLRGLYLLVFHEDGCLRTDYDVQAVFLIRQVLLGAKKATVPCSFESTEQEVLSWFEVDRSLPEPDRFWLSETVELDDALAEEYNGFLNSKVYAPRVASMDTVKRIRLSACLANLDKVSGIVTATLGPYDPSDWRFRHGPGAVSDITGPSNKFAWTGWSERLELEYPIADYGFHSYSTWADRCRRREIISSQELFSRMVAVPKSYSNPRLIAAEPAANMWCQQNLWHYMDERSKATWLGSFVRFHDESLNQRLCTSGSVTGALATLDLSSASDCVSCHLVGQLFRGNPRLLKCLRASRTHQVQQLLTPKVPELVDLRKFSTMGNACTFPVESFTFLSIALACVLTVRGKPVTLGEIRRLENEVSVYGDDIIVPVECRELLVEALEVLHFKVNSKKSYWNGNFRESCGVDSFHGTNVTPVYWKTFYDGGGESLASVIGTSNNLYQRFLLHASQALASTLPYWQLPMVEQGSSVTGLESRSGIDNTALQRRWNQDLQRFEIRIRRSTSVQKRVPTNNDSGIFQFLTEKPDPLTKWSHGYSLRPQSKNRLGWVSADAVLHSGTVEGYGVEP